MSLSKKQSKEKYYLLFNFFIEIYSIPVKLFKVVFGFPKESDDAFEDLKSKYSVSVFIFLTLTYLILAALIIRTWVVIKKTPDNKFTDALRNLDPAGIVLGFLGLAVSWIVFVYVQQKTEKENKEASEKIIRLTSSISDVNAIVKAYSSINPVRGLRQRLKVISEIYEHCENKTNDLYIMTHNIIYGRVLMHEVESLYFDENRDKSLNIQTLGQLYLHDVLTVQTTIDDISKKLQKQNLSRNIITLEAERYQNMATKILEDRDVINIYAGCEEVFEPKKFEKHYLYDSNESENIQGPDERRNALINQLSKLNEEDCNRLQKDHAQVTRVSSMPFQFIASIPKNINNLEFDGKCILIFSNLYDKQISQDENTACFSSVNEKLIKNLYYVFENIVKKHHEVEDEEEKTKKLFNLISLAKTCFVMHVSDADGMPEAAKGKIAVRFLDDFIAESNLKSVLRQNFREHYYLFKDDFLTDKDFKFNKTNFETIFVIGLFQNKITEELIQANATKFLLTKGQLNEKAIEVQMAPQNFHSNYDSKDLNSFDYALFSKIVYKGKQIIICGGCESYGTRKIGEYIQVNIKKMKENNETPAWKTEYQDSEFVSIYKIPTDPNRSIILDYHTHNGLP